jgi:transcriptional regulator with XRE-family HTH domain
MERSADDYQAAEREREALSAALELGRGLPEDWLALPPGRALRRLRKQLLVKQDEISHALGMRQSSVSKIERGLDARWSTLRRMFAVLGCDLAVVPVTRRTVGELRDLNRRRRLQREAEGRRALEKLIAGLAQPDEPG